MCPVKHEASVLLISAFETDRTALEVVLGSSPWRLHWARTYEESVPMLEGRQIEIVICERDLPDGTWKEVLAVLTQRIDAPLLIVASVHADNDLWSEVLHLGGFDVLAKPLEPKEVTWSLTVGRDRLRSYSISRSTASHFGVHGEVSTVAGIPGK